MAAAARRGPVLGMKIALVAVAGAAGALARYGIAVAVGVRAFPWSTLGINVTGSFLLGLLVHTGIDRGWPETTTVPLAAGFLGAFTTYSTFSNETFELLRADRAGTAALYLTASIGGGLLAAAAGYALARAVSS
jgi:fluoride exporter